MPNEKILIIDDDDDLVLAMRLPLQAAGFKVERAADADEGLEQVKHVKPDLILLDVRLGSGEEGFRVSSALRNPDPHSEYAAFSRIPILVLTALRAPSARLGGGVDLAADAFIEKPIEPDALW